ncbi:MAG: porin, partial [Pseudomonadota bacterium]
MNGGLKSISAAAMFAAAASLGGLSAQAADLGGNCCADLEERIAELEATTARKGTRVMSLKISGSVSARV